MIHLIMICYSLMVLASMVMQDNITNRVVIGFINITFIGLGFYAYTHGMESLEWMQFQQVNR